ncbi:MAG TPA: hypothetical protein VFW44_10755 [Bryobacteraceae bacterium]|nr:hypothetical protein [Bryobacteraceae bacterium]
MKKLLFVLFAGTSMATVAFAQENSNPPAEQKQAQASEDKCCSKDCCKDMKAAKHEHGSKKDKAKKPAMSCCK